jgi:hypothetical protein
VSGFVGLDPDLLRSFGRAVQMFDGDVKRIRRLVSGVVGPAMLSDPGVLGLCLELGEELGLLAKLAAAKADAMENAMLPSHVVGLMVGGVEDALLRSLGDGVGAGFDGVVGGVDRSIGQDGGSVVAMSPVVAADTMAAFLRARGVVNGGQINVQQIGLLLLDPAVSKEVKIAAEFLLENPSVFRHVEHGGGWADARDFAEFGKDNEAMVLVAQMFDRLDTGRAGVNGKRDGVVSAADVAAAIADTTGRFSAAEKAALVWMNRKPYALEWASRGELTTHLVERQVFVGRPDLAVAYLEEALKDPDRFFDSSVWGDPNAMRAFVQSAASRMGDQRQRTAAMLGLAKLFDEHLKQVSDQAHTMLDVISWIDPTQISDGLNATLYLAEGDYENAAITAGGMLVVFGNAQSAKYLEGKLAKKAEAEALAAVIPQQSNIVRSIGDRSIQDGTKALEKQAGELAQATTPVTSVSSNLPEPARDRIGELVEGAGLSTRKVNFNPKGANPNWGLTPAHLEKHVTGSGAFSLKTIDPMGNTAIWVEHLQDLAQRTKTGTTSNGMVDIVGDFAKADGSGTFKLGIRLSPKPDGTFDLITLLTKQ